MYLAGGPVVVSVMTWSASGVSDAVGDRFIADGRARGDPAARVGRIVSQGADEKDERAIAARHAEGEGRW